MLVFFSKLSLARHATQYGKNVIGRDVLVVFVPTQQQHGDPTFSTWALTFCTFSQLQTPVILHYVCVHADSYNSAPFKMCNLNPTETSTCRRCQSDSGRATLPSGLQHLFGLWPTHTHPREEGILPTPSISTCLLCSILPSILPPPPLSSCLVYCQRSWMKFCQTSHIREPHSFSGASKQKKIHEKFKVSQKENVTE